MARRKPCHHFLQQTDLSDTDGDEKNIDIHAPQHDDLNQELDCSRSQRSEGVKHCVGQHKETAQADDCANNPPEFLGRSIHVHSIPSNDISICGTRQQSKSIRSLEPGKRPGQTLEAIDCYYHRPSMPEGTITTTLRVLIGDLTVAVRQ